MASRKKIGGGPRVAPLVPLPPLGTKFKSHPGFCVNMFLGLFSLTIIRLAEASKTVFHLLKCERRLRSGSS